MFDLQQLINSSLSVRVASSLAQMLSPRVGYAFASIIAERIARQRNSQIVRAIRANQWVVHGGNLQGEALDHVVRKALHHTARCLFDLYHYVGKPDTAGELIVLEPSFQQLARRPEFDRRGLIIVGLHISNFDLVLHWVCRQGMRPLTVTISDPQGGRRVEYEMRKRTGLKILPASAGALRQALRHLQKGGMVLTGIDRPIPDPEVCPRFFGWSAALPLHHIFLALRAQVPLVIAVTNLQDDGKYHVFASEWIEMDHDPDPAAEMLRNAEKVLGVAAHFIGRFPEQWSVPLPVWPQVVELVPT